MKATNYESFNKQITFKYSAAIDSKRRKVGFSVTTGECTCDPLPADAPAPYWWVDVVGHSFWVRFQNTRGGAEFGPAANTKRFGTIEARAAYITKESAKRHKANFKKFSS